jgi:hypothetical protein
MPSYTPPGSDTDRLLVLSTVLAATPAGADLTKLLPTALRQRVADFVPLYKPAVDAVDNRTAGRAKEVSEKDTAKNRLRTHVQDFLEVLRRRTVRLEHNVSVLVHHGLPQSGENPRLRTEEELSAAALGIAAGAAASVTAGFPAMANPSAAEVAAALAAYNKESGEVAPADELVRAAQAAVAKLRDEADDLVADVKEEVSHALRKEEASTVRRVLRQLGYTFTPNAGETPEPAPPPAPVPAPVA